MKKQSNRQVRFSRKHWLKKEEASKGLLARFSMVTRELVDLSARITATWFDRRSGMTEILTL
jgi:hypothetical protein